MFLQCVKQKKNDAKCNVLMIWSVPLMCLGNKEVTKEKQKRRIPKEKKKNGEEEEGKKKKFFLSWMNASFKGMSERWWFWIRKHHAKTAHHEYPVVELARFLIYMYTHIFYNHNNYKVDLLFFVVCSFIHTYIHIHIYISIQLIICVYSYWLSLVAC